MKEETNNLDRVVKEYTSTALLSGINPHYEKLIPLIKLGFLEKDAVFNKLVEFQREIMLKKFEAEYERIKLRTDNKSEE